ncbi:MAG: efflux RND transporter periplasmic adaptor subunit [Bacteroidetes bacterium]|nr:efflux RND transporter periplasmic adaptor subunit [Bacteroidota bacterium]
MKKILFILLPLFLALSACTNNNTTQEEEESSGAKTPVTLTSVLVEPISETIELRATSTFQKKISVKSNLAGYIENSTLNIGDEVSQGQVLFSIKTKEASALQDTDILKDSSLFFSGLIKIKAQKSGIITTLDHLKGDYVQEGDQLGIISDRSSLVFILEVPFELHTYVKINTTCEISLPDNQVIQGKITSSLPTVDAMSQTQSFVVSPISNMSLPENLIAKIRIVKSTKEKTTVLPKTAVLANETQSEFWVMKLINDSIAVKIPVKKGIETSEKVEIADPIFNATDRILLNGNYGLSDTAKITIQKTE